MIELSKEGQRKAIFYGLFLEKFLCENYAKNISYSFFANFICVAGSN